MEILICVFMYNVEIEILVCINSICRDGNLNVH